MAKQENKQITPLITMDEETQRLKPLESEELLKIDDLFLDLKPYLYLTFVYFND